MNLWSTLLFERFEKLNFSDFWGPQKRPNFWILDFWVCLKKLNLEPTVLNILSCKVDQFNWIGGKLSECTEERNPCRAAIEMSEYGGFGEGTSSWDAIVTLKAIRPDDFSDYVTLTGEGEGRNRVDYNGNFF